jgi:hypothetical protein
MMGCDMISQMLAKELFNYVDGELHWKKKVSDKVVIGKKVGCVKNGHVGLKFNKKDYRVHQIVFLIFHGYVPKAIDHVDGNFKNNRIENLRPCNQSQNSMNKKVGKTNKSGFKNVTWKKERMKWKVELSSLSQQIFICYCDELEVAELISYMARDFYHKEFANHG